MILQDILEVFILLSFASNKTFKIFFKSISIATISSTKIIWCSSIIRIRKFRSLTIVYSILIVAIMSNKIRITSIFIGDGIAIYLLFTVHQRDKFF